MEDFRARLRLDRAGGYADEHINQYTREGLRKEILDAGFVIEEEDAICRSEMIFKARKPRGGR